MKYKRITITGKVQGVGFRYFVYKKAISRRARGYVRNLGNGDIEIVIDAIIANDQQFVEQLIKGPVLSRVEDSHIDEIDLGGQILDFNIR